MMRVQSAPCGTSSDPLAHISRSIASVDEVRSADVGMNLTKASWFSPTRATRTPLDVSLWVDVVVSLIV